MPQEGRPSPARRAALLLAELTLGVAVALAVLIGARPVSIRLADQALWVPFEDPYMSGDIWGTLFMTLRALEGETGCWTRRFAWPEGHDLCDQFPNPLPTDLIALAVEPLGLPLGYNLAMIGLLLSNGLAVWLAARLAGAGRLGGVLALALGAATPLVFYEVMGGRPASAWWAPAIAATALCVASLRSRWWAWLPLLGLGLTSLFIAIRAYPFTVALLLPWTVIWGVAAVLDGPGWRGRALRGAIGLGAAAALAYAISGPQYHVALVGFAEERPLGPGHPPMGIPTAPVLPGLNHWVGVGVVAVGVALLWGLARGRRLGVSAALAAALLAAVGLGPTPGGDPREDPHRANTPFMVLMTRAPLMRGCPRPDRYLMAAALLLAIAAGAAAGGQGRLRGSRELVALLLLLGVAAQSRATSPSAWMPWPPLLGLDGLDEEGATLDLPLQFTGENQAHWLAYVTHPSPRVNPMWREHEAWESELEWPLVEALIRVGEGPPKAPFPDGEAARAGGLKWVIQHRRAMSEERLAAQARLLRAAGAVVEEDGPHVVVWRLY